ncbi:type IV secretion protein Rhs [Apibacter muscae]|uniref:SpvB/TcaC N-terminal domain-containing protein n=1 Tax=Apibacter muscae TaxID=2509004 RepID=UPI0011AC6829|nr:SpvB/TcaC N-terminal domain-containing protein [Apibacter muscae]TWP24608.1 type IV secretion protein Rhs [Apibacter muscae]
MMRLSAKKARYISYFLLFIMAIQSFTPYVPHVVKEKKENSDEKNTFSSEGKTSKAKVKEETEDLKNEHSFFKPSKSLEAGSTLYSSDLNEGEIGFLFNHYFDNPQDNVFTLYVDHKPEKGQKAYIVYELYGVEDKNSVTKSINDRLSTGGYLVKTNTEWTKQKEEINSDWLREGVNHIFFSVPNNATYGYKIKNLKIEVENTTSYLEELHWNSYAYENGDTYVKGYFLDGKDREIQIQGQSVKSFQGEFETVLSGHFPQVELSIEGKRQTQTSNLLKGKPKFVYKETFVPNQTQKWFSKQKESNEINFLGASLTIAGKDLWSNQLIRIQNLRYTDIPALDMGMQNVTAKSEAFRFLPHGEHFSQPAVVKLPYDRTKIPNGYTEQDIKTYYFDLNTKHWVALERDSVDIQNQVIISKTTHFTDMINGVIQAPESPETSGFTPTTLSDIKVADPLAKVNQVAPPQANNRGSAGMGYSFEMPPARNGMSPSLGIQYNSDGGSGLLGEGWDLNTPSISIETRWGVPRYDANLETETYVMDGSQLVTQGPDGKSSVAHRGEKIARQADRFFFPRKEGSFAKIQRKGNSPSNYTWEVTDRKGTKYIYGGNNGVLKGTFTNIKGEKQEVISEWKLSRVEELHGDWIEYYYDQVEEPVRGGLTSKSLYLREVQAGNKGEKAHTVVKLTRGKTKQKQTNNARYGYLTSQNQLLTNVEIDFEGRKLREYSFEYKEGAFFTDLLNKVVHKDDQGAQFTYNTFDYYNTVEEQGGYYQPSETWNTQNDGLSAGFVNPLSALQTTGDFSDKPTALGGSKTKNKSGSIYVGIGLEDGKPSKIRTIGASLNYSYSESKGVSTLIDINGDGIPDKVFVDDLVGGMHYRPGHRDGTFGEPIRIQGASQFSTSYSNATSFGAKAIVGKGQAEGEPKEKTATIGTDFQQSKSKTSRYFTDVNGDGLVDLVVGSKVYFNHIEKDAQGNLVPTFTLSSADTPSPIKGGGVIDDSDTQVDPEEQAELIANNPLQDAVRIWLAPYDGNITVSGTATLLAPEAGYDPESFAKADGVRVAMQKNQSELKSYVITKDDHSPKDMATANLSVKAGDRIYFRVQSGIQENSNGDFDRVEWNPTIKYNNINGGTDANAYPTIYTAATETLNYYDGYTVVPGVDSLTIKGDFTKPVTSDVVTLKVFMGEEKALAYEKTFQATETHQGEWIIPISNPSLKDVMQIEMESPSYLAWETISFQPVVYFTRTIETPEGTSQTIEQTQPASVKVNATYESLVHPGTVQIVATKGKGKLKIEITPKVGITPEIKNKINGSFQVKAKNEKGVFYTGNLQMANGSLGEGAEQELDLPQGPVWVELYSADANREGLQNLATVKVILTDSLNAQTNALASVYRNWDLQGFGPLHRQWGHFSYNSMEGRANQPIKENLLVLPQSENDPNVDPRKMVFIPMHLDAMNKAYWQGNDAEVSIHQKIMTASRLGQKDVILDNPLSGLGSSGNLEGSCITGSGGIGVRQESKSESKSVMIEAGGSLKGTLSKAEGADQTLLAFQDLNGDGYPDIISKRQVQLTNTQGGFDGEIVTSKNGYAGFHNSESKSASVGLGGNPTHASSIASKAARLESATANIKGSFKGKTLFDKIASLVKAVKEADDAEISLNNAKNTPYLIPGGDKNFNEDEAIDSFTDVNGDGLPDKILRNKQIRLNLGYGFTEPLDWDISEIRSGKGSNNSLSLGFATDEGSWSGGIGLSNNKTHTNFSLMDINGDGLVDKVRLEGSKIHVSLNKGNSFADEILWEGLSEINNSSSVSESINSALTFKMTLPTLPPLKLTLNPSVNIGQSMSRTLEDLQDIDGDGFLDVVTSDREDRLHVQRSTIGKTNKLKTAYNPIGGSFTLDYNRSEATYDHPAGKWVLSAVETNDGINDDGANTRVEYRYSQGKQDRHEREFLGFGRVETLSVDTENSNALYRKSIQEYDVNNYYTAGNTLRSWVEDAQGKKYAETLNVYYAYEVKQNGANAYAIITTELCSDNQSAYTPLKYTKSMAYEGQDLGIVTSESFYQYDITQQYGEILAYKYSDQGNLGENGTGGYNYQTKISYTSNPAKNIYGLPVQVQVIGSDGKQYREVKATYDTNYANHLTQVSQKLNDEGEVATTDIVYDKYGNITQKTLPANANGERMWYKYRYDRDYHMYLERIDDAYGYTSELENYDYRYGMPLSTKDYNGYYMATTLDNLGRVQTITGPNEMELGLPYTIKFEYHPVAEIDSNGEIKNPAYAITKHYDPQHKGNDIETVSFVDGVGRALQVKKEGVITETDASGSNPKEKEVWIVSGRNSLDPYGRVSASYYPVTEDLSQKLIFNRNFDKVTPTRTRYDVMDRAVQTLLPDESSSSVAYGIDASTRTLVTTVTDAMGGKQTTYTNGSGLTLKTDQLSGPSGTISTQFGYDRINQLLEVTDTDGQKTTSVYDLAGRRTQVTHPSAGTVSLTYDALGNVTTRQTSNLAEAGQKIEYKYFYTRLTNINYPQNPQNNVTYHYGNKNAKENRVGRVVLQEDATGAQEFKYGSLGEITEVRRTLVIPNQAIATYVTQTKYDSWNRIEHIIYPDQEKVEYKYNTAGQLVQLKGSKAYSYNYVEKIGYDKFEQRNYLKYCNGSETSYTYDPQRRRLTNLQVWSNPKSPQASGGKRQIMNNQYTYDAVSNVLSVTNATPLPANGQSLAGGPMKHEYSYDGLYRLVQAQGTYTGADQKTASYTLEMGYDNLHNIVTKKQHLSQKNIMFNGGLKAGYDLAYTYDKTKRNQISEIEDINYRTEENKPEEKRNERKAYSYDANGNLVYINTALAKKDGRETTHTNERKLRWDEENRLVALDDNGYISNYWYDASGERVVKTSGESEHVYVNSLFAGGRTQTGSFSAYVNPYLVVNQAGKYTKHYYIGSQRVVSKLGDLQSYGADPRRILYAGANLDGISIDWKGKYQQTIQDIKDSYAYFEVPYHGKDNDDYVNGQGFCCSDNGAVGISPLEAGIGNGNVDYERMQYFYHADHLGSSSYITNLDGAVVQHIEYVPFGEVFLEERNNQWNSPYLFNGKELDEETGLYYYGARYYNPRESVWISTDPLSGYNPIFEKEHYIDGQHNGGVYNSGNLNTYGYTYQNPIKYVDPNGKQVVSYASKGYTSQFFYVGGADLSSGSAGLSDTSVKLVNSVIENNPKTSISSNNFNYAAENVYDFKTEYYAYSIKLEYDYGAKDIVLAGYSRGGVEVMKIARELDKYNIPVKALILLDAADGPRSSSIDRTIPGNVAEVFNYYQTNGKRPPFSHGGPASKSSSSNNTIIHNYNVSQKVYENGGNAENINHSNIDEAYLNNVINNINESIRK